MIFPKVLRSCFLVFLALLPLAVTAGSAAHSASERQNEDPDRMLTPGG